MGFEGRRVVAVISIKTYLYEIQDTWGDGRDSKIGGTWNAVWQLRYNSSLGWRHYMGQVTKR